MRFCLLISCEIFLSASFSPAAWNLESPRIIDYRACFTEFAGRSIADNFIFSTQKFHLREPQALFSGLHSPAVWS
jgi:hypothetical protein